MTSYPGCIGIILLNHYHDPYEPTSIMESNKGFFRGSVFFFNCAKRKDIYTPVNSHSWLENGPFEDVFPIEDGDIPLLC